MLKGWARRIARKLRAGRKPDAVYRDPAIEQYLLGVCSTPESRAYVTMHLGRLVRILQLTPPGTPSRSVLEMGAYMQITPALQSKLGYGSVRGCYLGPPGTTDVKEVETDTGKFVCSVDLFNAESDSYPYADASFDTVLCCEMIEHLSEDPMHLVSEVNRILKPGGHFVVSTPNVCALRAVKAVLHRYHPALFAQYTAREGGNAVAPRHAREYTPDEVQDLLEAGGFAVESIETGPYGLAPEEDYAWVIRVLQEQGVATDLRGDAIYAVARKTEAHRERYPNWLYTGSN